MSVDLKTLRELADAVDKDRGHNKSLLTRVIREAAAEITAQREGRSPTAKLLDGALSKLRVQTAALETVRAELDLPEHLAEIVGDALAKDVGRRPRAENGHPGSDSEAST